MQCMQLYTYLCSKRTCIYGKYIQVVEDELIKNHMETVLEVFYYITCTDTDATSHVQKQDIYVVGL